MMFRVTSELKQMPLGLLTRGLTRGLDAEELSSAHHATETYSHASDVFLFYVIMNKIFKNKTHSDFLLKRHRDILTCK